MTTIKEIETIRDNISSYIKNINHLESEIELSRRETAQAQKSLSDANKEIKELKDRIAGITQENENFKEAVKQFKELGEKDKREMDKMAARIETLEKTQNGS
ncbi:MAG: hypothetical protein V2I47_11000 [Bacteroidales bacterium]|jgi:chromosome segregation ATPase|nr:hypothetical protein [Bacteroidales bacterium]